MRCIHRRHGVGVCQSCTSTITWSCACKTSPSPFFRYSTLVTTSPFQRSPYHTHACTPPRPCPHPYLIPNPNPTNPNHPHPSGSRSRSRFLGKTPSVSGSSLMDLRTQISLLVTSSLLASMLNRCLNESDDTRHGIAYGDASYTLPLQVTACTILCCVCYIPLLLSFFCYPLPRDRTLDSGSRCFLSSGVPTITLDLHFLHSRFTLRKHIH